MPALTESMHVRLSMAEKAAAKKMADAAGRSGSNWIRSLILAEFSRQRRQLVQSVPQVEKERTSRK